MALSKIKTGSMADDSITAAKIADDAVTPDQLSEFATYGRRNLLYNGDMRVAQYATSTTGHTAINKVVTCDRWKVAINGSGTYAITQQSSAPTGFSKSLKLEVTTADTTPNYVLIQQHLEGQDLQRLKKGTSSANSVTLSFHVRSGLTGTYQVNLRDDDNGRIIGGTYTISSANTWEYKTITFAGDTSGTLNDDANKSVTLEWWLASGSTYNSGAVPASWEATSDGDRAAGLTVNLSATSGNDFLLTGVQLELGTQASNFEHISFNENLRLCQRYFEKSARYDQLPNSTSQNDLWGGAGTNNQTTTGEIYGGTVQYKVTKRAAPSVTLNDEGANSNKVARMQYGVAAHNNSSQFVNLAGDGQFGIGSASGTDACGIKFGWKADAEL